MPINHFRISNQEGTRKICVLDGQPYYQSTGRNSKMAGLWLPFERFAAPIEGRTGMMHKPYTEPNRTPPRIGDCYPPIVADAFINFYGANNPIWKRFKDIKCLYTVCLLSPDSLDIPVEIRSAVHQYIGLAQNEELSANFTFHPEQAPVLDLARPSTKPLTPEDYHDLTEILNGMGSTTGPMIGNDDGDIVLQDINNPMPGQAQVIDPNVMPADLAAYVNNTRVGGINPNLAITNQSLDEFNQLMPRFNAIRERHARAQQNGCTGCMTAIYRSAVRAFNICRGGGNDNTPHP